MKKDLNKERRKGVMGDEKFLAFPVFSVVVCDEYEYGYQTK